MLIGTHDSCAYKFNPEINFWDSGKWNKISKLSSSWLIGNKITNILKKFTLTQSKSIYRQLVFGCRVLDIRVSYLANTYRTNHTFQCEYLELIIRQIKNFFRDNPTAKPVHLLIKADYETRFTMIGKDKDFIEYIESRLFDLLNSGKIKIFYQPQNHRNMKYAEFIENFNQFDFVWLNVNNIEDFRKKFIEVSKKNLTNSIFNFTLTMDSDIDNVSDIFKLINTDLEEYAHMLRPITKDLIQQLKQNNNLPVYMLFDFIDTVSF